MQDNSEHVQKPVSWQRQSNCMPYNLQAKASTKDKTGHVPAMLHSIDCEVGNFAGWNQFFLVHLGVDRG